jgi:hypothetical protein
MEHEIYVTACINKLYELAVKEKITAPKYSYNGISKNKKKKRFVPIYNRFL